MKSGTHLIQELMIALGYGMYGQSRITPAISPRLDRATRLRMISLLYGETKSRQLARRADEGKLAEESEVAWKAVGWAWQLKFGMPLVNRYGAEVANAGEVRRAADRTASSPFSETPPGVCWILPVFDISRIDGKFIQEWSEQGEPRIIFNYRDPRDVVLSMVNFLCGKTAAGIGNFSEFQAFSKILMSKQSMEERLNYALTDPSFPGYGDFQRSLWLLNHPDICKVSYEELVGPQGGGSAQLQREAVARILQFVGSRADPETIATRLYNRDSFSFFNGQTGTWRYHFSASNNKVFSERFGDVLESYGYASREG